MARDVILGETPADWSREVAEASPPTTARGRAAMGGMALGTALSLALVTSPWWSKNLAPSPRYYKHTDYTGVRLPRRK